MHILQSVGPYFYEKIRALEKNISSRTASSVTLITKKIEKKYKIRKKKLKMKFSDKKNDRLKKRQETKQTG